MGALVAVVAMLFVYLAPALIAATRRHPSTLAIMALTILLGWTVIGWAWALIWSLTGQAASAAPTVHTQVVVQAAGRGDVVAAPPACSDELWKPQVAALVRQAESCSQEMEAIPAQVTLESLQKAETIRHLVGAAHRALVAVRDQARAGPPPRGHEPVALGPPTPLVRMASRQGRAYYRNVIPPGFAEYPQLYGPAVYDFAIVGHLHHQIELDVIAGGRRDAPVYFRTNALVYAEPDNPHDSHAVALDIGGWRIGYVARDEAPRFAAELAAIGGPGAFACRALIENGWPEWRVKLDLDRPLRVG